MRVFLHHTPGTGAATYVRNLLNNPPEGVEYLYPNYFNDYYQFQGVNLPGRPVKYIELSLTGAYERLRGLNPFASGKTARYPSIKILDLPEAEVVHTKHILVSRQPWVLSVDRFANRDYPWFWPMAAQKLIDSGCRKIIAHSKYSAESISVHGVKIKPEKICVIPYPVFIKNTSPKKHEGGRIILVGKHFVNKGGPELLRAFEKLSQEFPEARLKIFSPWDTVPAEDRKRISENKAIEFTGSFVPWEKVLEAYRESDIFCLFPKWEPMGNAALEAMACGLPLVVSDTDALPEKVDEGKNGFIVGRGRPEEVYQALRKLLLSESLRKEMGRNSRKKFMNDFNPEKIIARLGEVYEEAVRK